jgi:4-hydroxybenzoate polyprenyltransferase
LSRDTVKDVHGVPPQVGALEPPPGTFAPTAGSLDAGRVKERSTLGQLVRLLRPKQWLKNGFVLAPLLFSGDAFQRIAQLHTLAAFVVFSLLASSIYVFNDIADRESDRAHPVKRSRPIASGAISVSMGLVIGALLLASSISLSLLVVPAVAPVALAYVTVNALYTFVLKRVVIVDVFAIASFFVMRLAAGAAAVGVQPSVWLLLCGGLLALYLGFAKRRHELVLLGDGSRDHRAVLSQYSTAFLDQLSVVLLAVTIVSYIMYTLTSKTAALVGSEALSYSTVFVLYGVFRYLYLVHQDEQGGNPAETLMTDRALLGTVALWFLYCGYVLYR